MSQERLSHAEIIAEARRLQGEAVARFAGRAWHWMRGMLHLGGTTHTGIAAR